MARLARRFATPRARVANAMVQLGATALTPLFSLLTCGDAEWMNAVLSMVMGPVLSGFIMAFVLDETLVKPLWMRSLELQRLNGVVWRLYKYVEFDLIVEATMAAATRKWAGTAVEVRAPARGHACAVGAVGARARAGRRVGAVARRSRAARGASRCRSRITIPKIPIILISSLR
mgnify:CR=1 FL=1